MIVQTGGAGRYRYRNRHVKESGNALTFCSVYCPAFSTFSLLQIPGRVLSTICYKAIVEIEFSFVKRLTRNTCCENDYLPWSESILGTPTSLI